MRILIAGISGLVGSHLAVAARNMGWIVAGTSRRDISLSNCFIAQNAQDMDRAMDDFRPDILAYCSAWTNVDECEKQPETCLHENALLPGFAAKGASQRGVRFMLLSSSYIFCGDKNAHTEIDAPTPLNWYGESKRLAEKLVLLHTQEQALVVRTMGVYGMRSEGKDFLQQVVRAVSAGQRIKVASDQYGNFTYAGDLSDNLLCLFQQNAIGVWHIAGPDPCLCRLDIAKQICQLGGWDSGLIEPLSSESLNQKAKRPKYGGLDISKITAKGLKMRPLEQVWSR
jgi:dTDP-4-dehydrorhamnose reductase